MSKLPIWTPLASLFLALAWLLPNASPPWPSFHKDAWCAVVLCLLANVLLFKRHQSTVLRFSVNPVSAVLVVLAVMPFVQLDIGLVHFSGHAAIGFAYFYAAAITCVIGQAWEQSFPGRPGDFLFLALLLAAFGTSGLMLAQWLNLNVNDVWVNTLNQGARPYGNLVQPNNAATLLLLGMVSIFWFAILGRVSKKICFVGLAYLLFHVVLTGSRSGYLSFLLVVLMGLWIGWRRNELRPWRGVFLLLLTSFPLMVFLVTRDWWGDGAFSQQPFERNLTSVRILLYRAYFDAALASPWLGYGFEQGALTQLASARLGHQLPGLFIWAHNAFLDLATWFGLPVTLLAISAAVICATALLRAPFSSRRSIYFSGVCVIFVHGMVELPLAYAYFLLPFSLMLGAMLAGLKIRSLPFPRIGIVASLAGLSVLLALIISDYLQIESAFYTWRFKQANIGQNHPMDVPNTLVLNQSEALLTGLRSTPASITDKSLLDFEQATLLAPSAAAMQQLAQLQLRRGDVAGAQRTADMARILTRGEERKGLAARWRYLGTQEPIFLLVEWRE
ncbi:PglL family O-oligosaccharyltransferase [Hydrogenophaga sp.]|uniref:PglL family O-oligosaccharyltransferase n=1 Tax=Hydrogenophaga sp. TaxID=1904254 RepID=UPI002715829A|nr:O-antigen ligase family protein [Hydrogenophaga sp.]MDO9438950.1 Wzy polymerase domain-containing protein [Hydrogenophaga sp.]